MSDRILRLIMDSFREEFYDKAMSCISALRKESIKVIHVSKGCMGNQVHLGHSLTASLERHSGKNVLVLSPVNNSRGNPNSYLAGLNCSSLSFNILQASEGRMFNKFLEGLKEQLRKKASFWARMKEGEM